ncbi:MAG TPA: hypothetical protein V6C95_04605 [Coleofasciculaceae cyanobacterium]
MKVFKSLLIALVILASFVFAQPSFADKPKFLKNPDYIEVTKSLESLQAMQAAQSQTENYNAEDVQKKIDELEFQKYALETGVNWGQCRNETGNTLAVYGPKPDFDDDDFNYSYDNALYFLANGQTTKKKWDCNGVYLPSGVRTAALSTDGQVQELDAPVAIKVMDGTQLVITTNPDTNAIDFSVPPAKVFKVGEANWFIPNVTQAVIDTRVPNAPTAKIKDNQLVGMRTSEKNKVESKSSTEAKPQPEKQPQSEIQKQPQPNPPTASYLKRA